MANLDSELVVLTVGHSTRPLGEFIALLKAHSVARLIDVRTVPRSRHNPQFNGDTLPAALAAAGVGYEHLAGLGGFRRTHPGSLNTGWRNLSFRGYADYMQTSEFADNLAGLIARATHERIVLMCAEALPWRCHRSLIADALLVHGLRVEEITSGTRRQIHVLTRFAKVSGLVITYPPETSSPDSAVMDVDVDGTNAPLARAAHRATIRPIN
ncbi:MAG: DNA repair protein [Gemmatimonadetes bacterium]|nr:MAG: DNA repair protein [Gemmatimonadota bacterium]